MAHLWMIYPEATGTMAFLIGEGEIHQRYGQVDGIKHYPRVICDIAIENTPFIHGNISKYPFYW